MIKYALQCQKNHQFEGWFSNSADYDDQEARKLLSCPVCGSAKIEKALMAPSIVRSGAISNDSAAEQKLSAFHEDINKAAAKARDYVEKNFDHVGKRFPEEARRIHYGETPERPIYGEAEPNEVKELIDEGIPVAPVPEPAPDAAEVKKKLN